MGNSQINKILIVAAFMLAISACGRGNDQIVEPQDRVIQGVNFVGLSVSDMAHSSELYNESTNLQLIEEASLSDQPVIQSLAGRSNLDVSTQLMRSTNAQLLFMQFANRSNQAQETAFVPVNGPGIAHVCYQVNQETKAYDKFLAAGATALGDRDMVQLNPRNPVKYAYARDHDHTMFEVEHVDVAALDLPEPPKNDYRIRHVSLATPDIGRLIKFYSVLMEQPKPRRIGRFISISGDKLDQVSGLPESKIKMAFFQTRNIELEIIQYTSHPTEDLVAPRPIDALGYNMIVFDVLDLDQARQKFIDAGGELVSTSEPLFGGNVIFGRDPDGNLIGLQVTEPGSVISSKNFKDNGI